MNIIGLDYSKESITTDLIYKYEVWYRFNHEVLSDGTVRDVYGKEGGNTWDVQVQEYKITF